LELREIVGDIKIEVKTHEVRYKWYPANDPIMRENITPANASPSSCTGVYSCWVEFNRGESGREHWTYNNERVVEGKPESVDCNYCNV